jgi:hypothetical protein
MIHFSNIFCVFSGHWWLWYPNFWAQLTPTKVFYIRRLFPTISSHNSNSFIQVKFSAKLIINLNLNEFQMKKVKNGKLSCNYNVSSNLKQFHLCIFNISNLLKKFTETYYLKYCKTTLQRYCILCWWKLLFQLICLNNSSLYPAMELIQTKLA